MKNITITLPDDLARRAKVLAAEHNTSVSKYVGELLAEKVDAELRYEQSMRQWNAHKPSVLNESRKPYPSRSDVHER